MQFAPGQAFSGTMTDKAWAARSPDATKCALIAHDKRTESNCDGRNCVEAIQPLALVSGQMFDDVGKVCHFREIDVVEGVGKILRVKNAPIDTPVGLADLRVRSIIERFRLPSVARLSD
jgi:hypothetical protein